MVYKGNYKIQEEDKWLAVLLLVLMMCRRILHTFTRRIKWGSFLSPPYASDTDLYKTNKQVLF